MKNNIDEYYINTKAIQYLAGLDEAGRGSLAGPIVVACVILPYDYKNIEINDSKLLSSNLRKKLYYEIIDKAIDYSITVISVEEIEEINPKKSSIVGMERCISKLKVKTDFILTDAESLSNIYQHEAIIHGDQLSQSIAAASIIAKHYRDQIMCNYDKLYPRYGFNNNKGYGTKKHLEALKTNGITVIHRKTYKPVKEILKCSKNLGS